MVPFYWVVCANFTDYILRLSRIYFPRMCPQLALSRTNHRQQRLTSGYGGPGIHQVVGQPRELPVSMGNRTIKDSIKAKI